MIVGDSDQQRRELARLYILQFPETVYSRYPQRMGEITASSIAHNGDGTMISAAFDSNTPANNEAQRLSVRMEVVKGAWAVREAKLTSMEAATVSAEKGRVPVGTYAD